MACFNDSLFIEIITLVFITQLPKGVATTFFITYVYGGYTKIGFPSPKKTGIIIRTTLSNNVPK